MVHRSIFIASLVFMIGVTPVVAVTNIQELRVDKAASRTAAREVAKERWEELKATREAKREEIKTNIVAKREEKKAKISAMRDARKKQVVERLQTKLGQVNENRTDHFLKVLERLSTILDKIQSRTEKAKTEGKNVSAMDTAISSARTAISTAETAVNAQKTKTYTITVTDDNAARGEVGVITKQLQDDLQAVQKTVAAARESVQNVFRQIKTIVGSDTGKTPSATGSSTTP